MVEIYRLKVAELEVALNDDGIKAEAGDILQPLIDRVALTPVAMRRWSMMAALLLTIGTTTPARADDAVDCHNADSSLIATDPAKIPAACRRLADKDNTEAQYYLGLMYQGGQGVQQDFAEAARWFHRAADQGYAIAQNDLAIMYEGGLGIPQDYIEAAKWFRKAADQGNADSQYWLGSMYLNNRGVPQDFAEAAKWFRKAADQGDILAQGFLGSLYYRGMGVPQDYVQAHMWFSIAAAQGDDNAANSRDEIASKMTPSQIEKSHALAAAWKPTYEQ